MLSAKTNETEGNVIVAPPRLMRAEGHKEKPLSEVIRDGMVTIGPELALRVIQECQYERQRGARPLHISAMAMQIRKKEWTPGTQLHFARMTSDGWLRLVNGQHRLHAVIEANTPVPFQILVTDCKTELDVVRLYRRHDRLSVPRTVIDMLKAEGIPAQYDIPVHIARGVFRAALIIESGFGFSGRAAKADPYLYRSDEARLRICEPWWPVAQLFYDAMSKGQGRTREHLGTAGPLAVALVTLRDQEAKADAFWRGIANNDGLRRDDPRSAYLRFLNVPKSGRGAFVTAKGASAAWNAFFAGRTLESVRITETPIAISGCVLE